jgi:hypothetical protein
MLNGVQLNPNSNVLELDRPQNDNPAACVIAQQYSSTTIVSLSFHCRKEKFEKNLKTNITISVFKNPFV